MLGTQRPRGEEALADSWLFGWGPSTVAPLLSPSEYNCRETGEPPRTAKRNKMCCPFRPVRFGVTQHSRADDVVKVPQTPLSSRVSVPLCGALVGLSSSP